MNMKQKTENIEPRIKLNYNTYTRLKKHCRVKSTNDGQGDTMELWEDG